jgi:hypothetical protein
MAFVGGVYVASADIDGDGYWEIITGADAGGGPHVKVFNVRPGGFVVERMSFFAFETRFAGGARVAAGDISGDGTPDIIVGAGPGAGPHVRVFDGTTGVQLDGFHGSFFAYHPNFTGGVFVAAGDVDGRGRADIITGAGMGGAPHVRVFNGDMIGGQLGGALGSFYAFDQDQSHGVRVAVSDINGDGKADIIATPGEGGSPELRVFDAASEGEPEIIRSLLVEDPNFTGGIFVAGSITPESEVEPFSDNTEIDVIFIDGGLMNDLLV